MSTMWRTIRLGEVLTERQEIPDEEALALGNIRIVSKIRFESGRIELRQELGTKTGMILVRPGDLLLSGINAAKGAIAVYGAENNDPIAATIHYGAYSVVPERADIAYLWWYLRSNPFREILFQSLPEGIKTELKSKRLLPIEIPLPPLAEQRRIVTRIETLAAKIAETSTLRRHAAEEAEALEAAKMYQIFKFDEAQTTVGDFARVQGGFAFASGNYDENGVYQVVRIGNVRDGYLDLSRAPVRWNPAGNARVLKFELKPGDLVISMTGTREKRDYGFIAKVPENSRLLLNQRVGRFVVQREIDHDYLFHFLRSPFFRDRLFPSATGTANQANIGNGDIERIKFAPPSPPEQRRIVSELDALQAQVEALKRLQAEITVELNALLPSVLDGAFKGEL